MQITRKPLWLGAAGVVVLVVILLVVFASGNAGQFRLSRLSAQSWELPVMEYQFHGRPESWKLTGSGGATLKVEAGSVTSIDSYFAASCGVSQGTKQAWHWAPHSHRQTAIITLGQCDLTLKKVSATAH